MLNSESGTHSSSMVDLTTAALDAAVELDRLILKEGPIDVEPFTRLSSGLKNVSELAKAPEETLSIAPVTLSVLNQAVFISDNKRASTTGELAGAVAEYVDLFSKDVAAVDEKLLARLRGFCLALHRQLISESAIRDSSPFGSLTEGTV